MNRPTHRPSIPKLWPLLIILILGFGLRLSQPTLVEFKRDEATVVRLGQAIAYEGARPAVGVDSSLGIDNLPLTLYLMALPLRIWPDPLAAVLFTGLLNSLALVACYGLASAAFGHREAVISTLLFAVGPWAVLYARKIWARTLPLATLAFMASLYLTFVRRKRWALVPAFAALAGLLGLQLEGLAFVPILGLCLLLFHREVSWRPLLLGVAVFGVLMLPYLVYDARHGWANARGLLDYAGGESYLSWDAVRFAFELVGSRGIEGQAGRLAPAFRQRQAPFWWLNRVLELALVAGLIDAVVHVIQGQTRARRRTFALLLLWFAVPILLQIRTSAPTQPHYFVMLYPAPYLLIAAVAVRAFDGIRSLAGGGAGRVASVVIRGAIVALLLATALWQIAVTAELRTTMVAHPSTGGYGIPLRYTRQAARAARSRAREGEIVVLSPDTRPFLAETPTVFDALLFGVPHRFANPRHALPVPQSERVIYLEGPTRVDADPPPAVRRLVALPSGQQVDTIALQDGTAYRLYRWLGKDRSELLAGMTALGDGVRFANGVVLAAYETHRDEGTLEVWLTWWLQTDATKGPDEHFTVQLLDGNNAVVAQDDHAAYPSTYWQTGDVVLSRFVLAPPLDLPLDDYHLRAGIYHYPMIEVVPVVNPQGQPVDDGVTLTD